MIKKAWPFYLGTLWETGRFFFLFLLVSLVVNPTGNPVVNLLLLWISAGQIGAAVLFFLIAYLPEKFLNAVKFLAFWKFIGMIPSLVFALSGAFLPKGLSPQGRESAVFGTFVPGVILFIDFLFLVYLILYKADAGRRTEAEGTAGSLPGHEETTVEEK